MTLLAAVFIPGVKPVAVARRGAGFLEYALIALVAIVIFVLFRGQITGFITRLWTKITSDSGV